MELRPADERYGYEFASDGLLTLDEACDWLKISRQTLDRLCADGLLRRGKSQRADVRSRHGRVYICKRSAIEYARGMEVITG
jgi:predicted site-specific integrase-resolvase